MRHLAFGVLIAPLFAIGSSEAYAAPTRDDDAGSYIDDFTDGTGIAAGATNVTTDGNGGWVSLVSPGTPGTFTTRDIAPTALSGWGTLFIRGNGAMTVEVRAGGTTILAPSLVASSDPAYTRMVSLAAVPASTTPIQIRVTFQANGPAAPIVDALRVTWSPKSTLKLATQVPATLCSGATGVWKFPLSVSNVSATHTVVTVALPSGTLSPSFLDQASRLQFNSATNGGAYNAGPNAIVVDGVSVAANTVYWRLGDVRFGSSFPLTLSATIPNGTLDDTRYVLVATATAANATPVTATSSATRATATSDVTVEKVLTGAYRIADQWRAKPGSTIGYTLTVRNGYAPTCRATAERIVLRDALQIVATPSNAYPYAAAPTILTPGLTFTNSSVTLHAGDAAGHAVVVPANAVYAQITALAPGASATFQLRLPLNAALAIDDHVVNNAIADSGYLAQAGEHTGSADFYVGIDYAPHGDYAKGDAIRGSAASTANEDNAGLVVGFGESFKFLLTAQNGGASVLRDTTMFDKLPLASLELVDVYVPATSGAQIWYYAASSPGADNAADNPPGYTAATGALSGWTTSRPSDAAWVAVSVPRIGSRVITDTNGAAPLTVTAEIGMRVRVPTNGCLATTVVNSGWFRSARYEDAVGAIMPTNATGTSNNESVAIVPRVPSFARSYAYASPGALAGTGDVTYHLNLENRVAGADNQTDAAEDVVVRVKMPQTFVNGVYTSLDLVGVDSGEGAVDYAGLPAYFDIHYPTVGAVETLAVDVVVHVPKGVLDGASAQLLATIDYQDVGDECPVSPATVSATASFAVSPFLQVDKRLDYSFAGRDRAVKYTLRSVNSGDGAALGAVVFDRLPRELDFVRALAPELGQKIYFSQADVPQLPADVRAAGDFSAAFVTTSGLFAPGVVSGGYVTSPFPKPTWIAVLLDDPTLSPSQLPANGVARSVVLEMHVPAAGILDTVIVNEANIASLGLLPAVSNRPQLLVSDAPALAIDGVCPGVIASGENLHLVERFTNNSTNGDAVAIGRIAVPTALATPIGLSLTSAEGTLSATIPDPTRNITATTSGGVMTISWDITAYLGRELAPGEWVDMDLEIEAAASATGTQIPLTISGSASRDVSGVSVTVNVGAQCALLVSNPDLVVQKLVDRGSAVSGDALTYTLVVKNAGPHDALAASVVEALPAGLTIVPGTTHVTPSSWHVGGEALATGASDTENGGAVYVWDADHGNALIGPSGVAGFVPGHSDNIYISFRVNVGAVAAGSTLRNCARAEIGADASGDVFDDENSADNLACVTTRVPYPDPKIVKSGPLTVLPGQGLGYTLTWSNASRQAASAVVFYDHVPDADHDGDPDLTLASVVAPAGVTTYYSTVGGDTHPAFAIGAPSGWTADLASLGGPASWVALVVGDLAGNAPPTAATIGFIATDPDVGDGGDIAAGTSLENCALIELNGGATEESTDNDVSCVTTKVPGLNVALDKTCDPEGVYPGARPGDATAFTLTLANRGTTPAYGVRFVDPTPAWFTFGASTPAVAELAAESGGSASFVDGDGDAIAGGIAWTQVGDSWYLGSTDAASPVYYRKIGMPAGTRTQVTISGAVAGDVLGETLVSNSATIASDRRLDSDPEEDAGVRFDNSDACALVVHRPDPSVVKTASLTVAGAGDVIDYSIGYDNRGLASADDVVIEDVLPDGVGWVVGSLVDVPADATVSYYDGASWGYTPVGADGDVDLTVKGVRVSFDGLAAPLGGGFKQDNLVSFARGTYVGTHWDANAHAIVPDDGAVVATYTSPIIPNDAGVLEWVSLITSGSGSIARPRIEVLDGAHGTVLLTLEDESSLDLGVLDPTVHPSLVLRATFATASADYANLALTPVSGSGGAPASGYALMASDNYVAGLVGRDDTSLNRLALWKKVGDGFEAVDIGTIAADRIVYLDDNYLVVVAGAVTALRRNADDTWSAEVLGVGDSYYGAMAVPLEGDNHVLCRTTGAGVGPDRACLMVAFYDGNSGYVLAAYDNADGWVTTIVPGGYTGVGGVNRLGYIMVGGGFFGDPSIARPTGSGWASVTMPTIAGLAFMNHAFLSTDSADILMATSQGSSYDIKRLFPSADPAQWTYETIGTSSSSQLNYFGPDGSFTGYLGTSYDDDKIWRRSGSTFPPYDVLPYGSSSVSALGPDGLATGTNYISGITRPTFWKFNGSGYEPSTLTASYFTDVLSGAGNGFDASGALAYGSNYDVAQEDLAFIEDEGAWTAYQLLGNPSTDQHLIYGASTFGWVGSIEGFGYPQTPAVWKRDQIIPGAPADLEATPLATPLLSYGEIQGATPGGCMIGTAGPTTTEWTRNPDGSFTPTPFTAADGYTDIAFVVETPDHRIFANARNAAEFKVGVELICGASGFTVVGLPLHHGESDGTIDGYVDGVLQRRSYENYDEDGGWVLTGTAGIASFDGDEAGHSQSLSMKSEAGLVFGAYLVGSNAVPFVASPIAAGGDDFTYQALTLPDGFHSGRVIDYADGLLLVGLVDADYNDGFALYTQAAPGASWTIDGEPRSQLNPIAFVGGNGAPTVLAMSTSYETVLVSGGSDATFPYDPSAFLYERVAESIRRALDAGIVPVFDYNNYVAEVLAQDADGAWVATTFGSDEDFDGFNFIGELRPGVYLGSDYNGLYVLNPEDDGTMGAVEIDTGDLQVPYGFDAKSLGDVSPDGAFMVWMSVGSGDEDTTYESVMFYPDAASPSGYAFNDLGLVGDHAITPTYPEDGDLSPGRYLGNGCWTAPENLGDPEYSQHFQNGIDPNGTSGLRLFACASAPEPQALASWSLAYRGNAPPAIGYETVVQRVCQREIANTATISSPTAEVTADNDSSTATVAVASADVAVSLVAPASVLDLQASPSTTLTVTVTNNGPSAATGVVVDLALPAGVTAATGHWSLPRLAVGASESYDVAVTFADPTGGASYVFALGDSSESIDCDTDNDAVALTLLAGSYPDIQVKKTGPATVHAFEPIAWDLTWTNVGNAPASGFTAQDSLPGGPFVGVLDNDGGVEGTSTITWEGQALGIAETTTHHIIATVDDCSLVGTTLTNMVAAPLVGDANPSDNEAAWSTVVLGSNARLDVDLVVSQATVAAGGPLHVTAYYRNAGTAQLTNGEVTVSIPAGFVLDPDSISDDGVHTSSSVTWGFGVLPVDAAGSMTFNVTGSALGSWTFNAIADGDDACPTEASVSAAVAPEPIAIAKVADVNNACAGDVVTWSIVVSNPSGSPVTGVVIDDVVPAGTTYVAGSIAGPGASVSGTALHWNIGTLGAGASTTLGYRTRVAANNDVLVGGGPSWATSSASGSGNATAVQIDCDAALTLSKAVTSTCNAGVDQLTITLAYANESAATVHAVVVEDYIGHLPGQVLGTLSVFPVGDLAAGAHGVISYTVDVTGATVGSLLMNRASIYASDAEPQASNESATPAIACEAGCVSDSDCDDGDFCDGVETCEAGTCQAGFAPCGPDTYCDETTDNCDECESNLDCDDGNYCNGSEQCNAGTCGPGFEPCTGGEFCNETTDTCDECVSDGDCDDSDYCDGVETCNAGTCGPGFEPCAGGEYCNETTDTCDECESDLDCDDGDYCDGVETCTGGTCGPGFEPCAGGEYCNETTDTCDECESDLDCDDGNYCNGSEQCSAGVCMDDVDPCTGDEYCDETMDTCNECQSNLDCDDGNYCNGSEQCSAGVCMDDVDPCTGGEFCNETTDTCDECESDLDCDDGDYCNGTEHCNAGTCRAGFVPCLISGFCNETTDTCDECQSNLDCDDGNYCDGAEQCNSGTCGPGFAPCMLGEFCDETMDTCNECQSNLDCDDGNYCNGSEQCSAGVCMDDVDPCTGDQYCDETMDTCNECQSNLDCDDGNYCNGSEQCSAGVCMDDLDPCPAGEFCNESSDTCDECQTSLDCDDGLYCDGAETCEAGHCQDGAPPCAGDPMCDEAADTCGECVSDSDCDDGLYCDGAETCVAGTCAGGTAPCEAGEICDDASDTCAACDDDGDCDDSDICTDDHCVEGACDNDAIPPRAVSCGTGQCGQTVDGTETCADGEWTDDCELGEAGPDTSCDAVRVAYAIVDDANGEPYGTIRCFQDLSSHLIGCETMPGSTTELKIYDAFFCGDGK